MGRLADSVGNAGMNAGASVVARMKRVSEIKTDPRLGGMFAIKAEILAAIVKSMRESGYDKSQPIVLWKGKDLVVDGHTRLLAAREAGLGEIPVEEKDFDRIDDAKLYAYKRQAERRNLTASEILAAATELRNKDTRDGSGRSSEILARELGLSPSTVKHAKAVAGEAPPEIIEEVKKNRMSINRAYLLTKGKAGAGGGKGGERGDREYEGSGLSGDAVRDGGPGDSGLERLEIRVHRENINIAGGDDARFEAARAVLRNLRDSSLPEAFTQDIRAMLQALFREDLDGQKEEDAATEGAGEAATEAADPDIRGTGSEG
jgi:ParB family chromosome partitioning protein